MRSLREVQHGHISAWGVVLLLTKLALGTHLIDIYNALWLGPAVKPDPLVWDGNTDGDNRLGGKEVSIGNGAEVARKSMDVLVSACKLNMGGPAHVVEVFDQNLGGYLNQSHFTYL